jgi:hypothetical protein
MVMVATHTSYPFYLLVRPLLVGQLTSFTTTLCTIFGGQAYFRRPVSAAENSSLFSAVKLWPPKIKLLKWPIKSFFLCFFLLLCLTRPVAACRAQHPRRRSPGHPALAPPLLGCPRAAQRPQRRPPPPAHRPAPPPAPPPPPPPPPRPRPAPAARPCPAPAARAPRRQRRPEPPPSSAAVLSFHRLAAAKPPRATTQPSSPSSSPSKGIFCVFIPYFWRPLFNCRRN